MYIIREKYGKNREFNLSEDFSISVNFNLTDITEIGSNKTSFSKTFTLKGTANNNDIFDVYNVSLIKQRNPKDPIVVDVYYNNVLMITGNLFLLSINHLYEDIEYECSLIGNIISIFDLWKQYKLSDLDFSEYDHLLNKELLTDSWWYKCAVGGLDTNNNYIISGNETPTFTEFGTPGKGYVYPFVDYGLREIDSVVEGKDTNYNKFAIDYRPGLYIREIFEKSFTKFNYNVKSSLMQDEQFSKLIMLNNTLLSAKDEQLNNYNFVSTCTLQTNEYGLNTYPPTKNNIASNQKMSLIVGPFPSPTNGYITKNAIDVYVNNFQTDIPTSEFNIETENGTITIKDNNSPNPHLENVPTNDSFKTSIRINEDGYYEVDCCIYICFCHMSGASTTGTQKWMEFNSNSDPYRYIFGLRRDFGDPGTAGYFFTTYPDNSNTKDLYTPTPGKHNTNTAVNDKQTFFNDLDANKIVKLIRKAQMYFKQGELIRFDGQFDYPNDTKWTVKGLASNNVYTKPALLTSLPNNSNSRSYIKVTKLSSNTSTTPVRLKDYLPNVTIYDFMSDIKHMFNLVYNNTDNANINNINSNTIEVEPYDEYFKSSKEIDFNKFIDLNKGYKRIPTSLIDTSILNFTYSKGDGYYDKFYFDTYNRIYGDSQYDMKNQFSNKNKDIKISFESTINVVYANNYNVPMIANIDDFANKPNERKKANKYYKILYYGGMFNTISPYNLFTNEFSNASLTLTRYGYAGMYDRPYDSSNQKRPQYSLEFHDPVLQYYYYISDDYLPPVYNYQIRYYTNYLDILTNFNSEIFEGYFYLPNDIVNSKFDFKYDVLLFGRIWRINKIENYINSEIPCKVQLYSIDNLYKSEFFNVNKLQEYKLEQNKTNM
jgi:hypothetical protein